MTTKRLIAAFTAALVGASSLALSPIGAGVALADDPPTEVGVEARPVTTDLRCAANAPVLGAQDADQGVTLTTISPKSVRPGVQFQTISQSDLLEVPSDVGGYPINTMRSIVIKTVFSSGATFDSATLDMSSAYYQATPTSPQVALPGTAPSVSFNTTTRVLTLTLPGPFAGGSLMQAPKIVTTWTSTTNGQRLTSNFGGTIPTSTSTFPWADPGFSLIVNADLPSPIGTSDIPTYCAPNYGARSNIPANIQQTAPFLGNTYTDDQPPTITFNTPKNNLVYDLDSEQIVDFQCDDPSGVATCVGTQENGTLIDTSEFGTFNFTVTSTDEFGFQSEQTITYVVNGNSAPDVTVGPDQTVASNVRVDLSGSATDPDAGQLVSYYWDQVSGPAVTLLEGDDPFAGTTHFTSPPGPATLVFRLRADDGFATGEDTVTVTVNDNTPPAITNLADSYTINTRTSQVLNAAATDVEGYPLTYKWTQVDADGEELAADSPERVITGQPTTASITVNAKNTSDAQTYHLKVRVSDGDSRADTVKTVTVNVRANRLPAVTAGSAQEVTAKTANVVTLSGAATDADGHAVVYLWTQVDANGDPVLVGDPDRVTLSNVAVANPTFTAPQGPKTLHFTLAVSDPYDTSHNVVTVDVLANQNPVFNPNQASQSGRGGGTIAVTGAATDPDGHAVSYQWAQVDSNGDPLAVDDPSLVTINNATSATMNFAAPFQANAYQLFFKATASDAFGGSVSMVVTVDVLGNRPPVASSPNLTPARNVTVSLNGSAIDPDGHTITAWQWTQVDVDGVALDNLSPDFVTLSAGGAAQNVTFTSPATAKTLYFHLVATDQYGMASAPITVTVTVGNKAPVANAGANTTGTAANASVTLTGSATDADGADTLTYAWTQVTSAGDPISPAAAEKVTINNPNSATATFTTPIVNSAVTVYMKLTVTDSQGATGTATRSIGVNANRAPASVPTPTVTNPAQASRTVGTYSSFNIATTATDPDGTSSSLFNYSWIQTSGTGSSTDCRPTHTCGTNVPEVTFLTTGSYTVNGSPFTATPTTPVIQVPGAYATTNNIFVRVNVNDGFGAVTTSANLTYVYTNSVPTVQWAVRGTGSPATAVAADTSPRNPVWGNAVVEIDGTQNVAKSATTSDPDGAISWTLLQYTSATNTTACSTTTVSATQCQLGLPGTRVTNQTNTTGKFTFTIEAGRNAYFLLRATQAGTNTDTRFTVVSTNTGNTAPTVGFGTTPTLVYTGGPAQTITLDGTATDAQTSGGPFNVILNTAPAGALANQTLSYQWRQTNSAGTNLAPGDPDLVTLSSATALKPTFTAPTTTKTLYFKLEVSDGVTTTTSAVRAVAFEVNTAPVVQQDKVINIRPGRTVTLNPTITDANTGQVLTYAWVQTDSSGTTITPTVTLSSTTVAAPTFTSPATPGIDLYFKVTATDPLALSTSGIVHVIVGDNAAPIPNVGQGQTGKVTGETVTLSAAGSTDADGDPLTFVWTQVSGTTVTLTGANTVSPTFTVPDVPADETLVFMVTVSDNAPSSGQVNATVDILANRAPVAAAGPNQSSVPAGATVTLDGSGSSDPDGHTITYAWTQTAGPAVTLSSSTAQKPTFSAPATNGTLLTFKLVVTDSFGKVSGNSFVTISTKANRKPLAVAGSNQSGKIPGETVTLDGTASSDPDGHSITYSWTQIDPITGDPIGNGDPLKATLSSATAAQPTFRAPAQGTVWFSLTVTDQYGLASDADLVNVTAGPNSNPTVNAGPNQSNIEVANTVHLSGTASDVDNPVANQTLTYAWTQRSGTTVTLTGANTLSPSFSSPNTTGDLVFRLTVTDGYGGSAFSEVTIGTKANAKPLAVAGDDQTGKTPGQVVTLDGTASSDPENHSLVFTWTQVDPITGDPINVADPLKATLSSATAVQPTFRAPAGGTLVFKLVVTDQFGLPSDADLVNIEVDNNQNPTVNAGDDQAGIQPNKTVHLTGTMSDSDNPVGNQILSVAWTQQSGTAVTLTGANTLTPSFTSPNAFGDIVLRMTVTDGYGGTSFDEVTISVLGNAKPVANAGTDQSNVAVSATVQLDGSGSSDPDGHGVASYAWTQVDLSGNPVVPATATLSSATAQKPTFVVPGINTAGVYRFRLVVTDGLGLASDPAFVSINTNANAKPVANAGTNQTVADSALVTLAGSFTDPENHTATYAWTQVNGQGVDITPTVTLSSATALQPTFTAPHTVGGASLRFKLVVTDQFGAVSNPSFVSVSVLGNRAPTAVASASVSTAGRTAPVSLIGASSSDPDAHTITYQWVQVDPTTNVPIASGDPTEAPIAAPTSANTTFTAPPTVGVVKMALIVTDQFGLSSAPAYVTINLVSNNAPSANAGAAQTNKAANSVVTLSGTVTDIDAGETFTWAWSQVDSNNDPIAGNAPEKVTLNTPNAQTTTFTTKTLNSAHTLHFKLVVTDSQGATSTAFTTVGVNANRAITGLAAPTVAPTDANVAWRTVGRGVQLTLTTAGTDPDGNPSAGWTYEWVQTDAAGNACAPNCAIANVNLITSGSAPVATAAGTNTNTAASARQPIFAVPPVLVAGATLYFKARVNDGFGAIANSNVITVALTNSAPVLQRANILAKTGQDLSVNRTIHTTTPCGTTASNCQNLIPISFAATTAVTQGMNVQLDGRNAAVDPDGGPVNVDFQTATPALVTAADASGNPTQSTPTAGACATGARLTESETPNVWNFQPPTDLTGFCRIQFRATDSAGSSTTWGLPAACVLVLLLVVSCDGAQWYASSSPAIFSDRDRYVKANNITLNTQADFWFNIRPNVGGPNANVSALPTRVFNSSSGAGATVLTLNGSTSTDPDTTPVQPLSYKWEQLDPDNDAVLEAGDPRLVTLANPNAATTTFTAPEGGPAFYKFQLTVSDGLLSNTERSSVVKVTTRRPVAVASASVEDNSVTEIRQGERVDLSSFGSSSPDGRDLTYAWRQVSGPEIEINDFNTDAAWFYAPNATGSVPEDVVIELVARDGYSAGFKRITLQAQPVAEAPTDVSGDPGNQTVDLSWSAPTETNGSTTTGFRVQIQDTTATTPEWTTVISNTESFDTAVTLTDLTNGTPYIFRVAQVGSNGVGGWSLPSDEVTPRTIPSVVEPAPTAVPTNEMITVSWTAPNNGGSDITGYQVQQSTDGGDWETIGTDLDPAELSLEVTGLTNGTPYQFRVAATNVAGTSDWSEASTPVAPRDVPGAPTDVRGTPLSSQVSLQWTAPTVNGGSPITGYRVERRLGTGAWTAVPGNATGTTKSIFGLVNGQSYTFRVYAISAGGEGAASEPSAPIVPGRPLPPTNVTVIGTGKTTANLSWTAPTVTGGSGIQAYKIEQKIGDADWTILVERTDDNTPSLALTGITRGITYLFRVSAINSIQTSDPSESTELAALVLPTTKPGKPTAVKSSVVTTTSAKVTWKAPKDNGGSPITGYKIEVRKGKLGTWTLVKATTNSTATTFVVTKLKAKASYFFRISAINAKGTSAPAASKLLKMVL